MYFAIQKEDMERCKHARLSRRLGKFILSTLSITNHNSHYRLVDTKTKVQNVDLDSIGWFKGLGTEQAWRLQKNLWIFGTWWSDLWFLSSGRLFISYHGWNWLNYLGLRRARGRWRSAEMMLCKQKNQNISGVRHKPRRQSETGKVSSISQIRYD